MASYGTSLSDGTKVIMTKLDNNVTYYKEMVAKLKEKEFTNIIGFYDLTAIGDVKKGSKLTLNVDKKYEGQEVEIAHLKHDGSYELLRSTVKKNGKITVTVDELSPFMIATKDVKVSSKEASNNAQTSSMNVGLYLILSITSLGGIVLVTKKKIA